MALHETTVNFWAKMYAQVYTNDYDSWTIFTIRLFHFQFRPKLLVSTNSLFFLPQGISLGKKETYQNFNPILFILLGLSFTSNA